MKLLNIVLITVLMLGSMTSFGQKLKLNTNTKLNTHTKLKKGTALKLNTQIPIFKNTKALSEQVAQTQEFKLPETTTKIMTFKKADSKTSTAPSSNTSTAAKRSTLSARSMYRNRNYLTSNGTTDGLRGVIHLKKGERAYRRKVNGSWRTFRNFNNDYLGLTTYLTTRTVLVTAKIRNRSARATSIKVSSGGNTHTYSIGENQTKDIQFIVSPTRRGYYRSYIHIDGDAVQRVEVKNVVVQEL